MFTRSAVAPGRPTRPRWLPHRYTDVRVSSSSAGLPEGANPATPTPAQKPPEPQAVVPQLSLTAYHYLTFAVMLIGGLLFLALLLYFTGDMQFTRAGVKVVKRLLKTVALRQVLGILAAMAFVRYGLEPVIKNIRTIMKAQGTWEKSSEYYILREVRAHASQGSAPWAVNRSGAGRSTRTPLRARHACCRAPDPCLPPWCLSPTGAQLYKPLEFLFLVAAFTTLAENFLPQLIAIPKASGEA